MQSFPEISEIKRVYIESYEKYVNDPDGIFIHLLDFFDIKDADGFDLFYQILSENSYEWAREIIRGQHEKN